MFHVYDYPDDQDNIWLVLVALPVLHDMSNVYNAMESYAYLCKAYASPKHHSFNCSKSTGKTQGNGENSKQMFNRFYKSKITNQNIAKCKTLKETQTMALSAA